MSAETLIVLVPAIGAFVVSLLAWRRQTRADEAKTKEGKSRLYREMEQEILANYREQMAELKAENEKLRAANLDLERRVDALEEELDKLRSRADDA
jgi:predicted RNase H-like nuclease (RuvC/YqgF family)